MPRSAGLAPWRTCSSYSFAPPTSTAHCTPPVSMTFAIASPQSDVMLRMAAENSSASAGLFW